MRLLALFVLSFVLLGSGCKDGDAHRLGVPTGRLPKTSRAYKRVACVHGSPSGVAAECGYVTVPESPGSASTIQIYVARFFIQGAGVARDPVVMLTGGPGQSAADLMTKSYFRLLPILANRDLVAIDQRGTGESLPSLACPETDSAATHAQRDAALLACRARITAGGTDLAAFGTANNAADIEAVRVALGYPMWNLLGISYGTRLALTVMRDHPAGLRSVILSSIVPLEVDILADIPVNGERAFQRIFDGCAAQPTCALAHPMLESRFHDLVAAWNASPEPVVVGGASYPLSGNDLVSILFSVLYDASSLPSIPKLIDDVIGGDTTTLAEILPSLGPGGIAYGMYLSAQCAEEVPFADLVNGAAGVDPIYRDTLMPLDVAADCALWNVPAAPAIENQPVSSDVPTLLISGGFDPITPPAYADRVAMSLADATSVVFENAAHSTGTSDACSQSLMAAFLHDTVVDAADTACVTSAFPLTYRSARDFFDDRPIDARALARRLEELPLARRPAPR